MTRRWFFIGGVLVALSYLGFLSSCSLAAPQKALGSSPTSTNNSGSISGSLTVPSGVDVSPTALVIRAGLNGTTSSSSSGHYNMTINPQAPVLAAAVSPDNSPMLMNIFDSASTSNNLNVTTTAVTMVFMGLGLYTTDPSDWPAMQTTISEVPAVQNLASLLSAKLAQNPDVLSENPPDQDIVNSLDTAVAAAQTAIGSSAKVVARTVAVNPQSAAGLSLAVNSQNDLVATNAELRYVYATVEEPSGSTADTLISPSAVFGLKPTTTILNPIPLTTPVAGVTETYTVRVRGGLDDSNGLYNASTDGSDLANALSFSIAENVIVPLFSIVFGTPIPTNTAAVVQDTVQMFGVPLSAFAKNALDEEAAGDLNLSRLASQLVNTVWTTAESSWPELTTLAVEYFASEMTEAEIVNSDPYVSAACHIISLLTNGLKMGIGIAALTTTDMVDVYTVKIGSGSTQPSANFSAQQQFAAGILAEGVAVADVNGDGRPDVIIANQLDTGHETVTVLPDATPADSATASFGSPVTLTLGSGGFYTVSAADLNGDGRPDIIAPVAGALSVLLNTTAPGAATPSFSTPQTISTESDDYAVAVADLNGDGKPDLLVANFNAQGSISVFRNETAANASSVTFASPTTLTTGSFPGDVTTADLNGDGRPDIIAANQGANTVSIYLNTTPGASSAPSFSAEQTLSLPGPPYGVTTADINGDGKPDLLVAIYGSPGSVETFINTTPAGASTASFAPGQSFTVGSGPYWIATADFNGDGKPDVVVPNSNDDTVSVLLDSTPAGASTASFAPAKSYAVGTIPLSVATGDINGDGRPDIVAANEGGDAVSVLINTTQ